MLTWPTLLVSLLACRTVSTVSCGPGTHLDAGQCVPDPTSDTGVTNDGGTDGGADTGTDGGADTGTDGGADTGADGGADTGDDPGFSADCWVDASGGGDSLTIQGCIDVVLDGEIVGVRPGTYAENIDFSGKGIEITAVDGPDATTIDAGLSGPAVKLVNHETDAVLDGFRIENGSGTAFGKGLLVGGGGIQVKGATATLRNLDVRDNDGGSSGIGGGLNASASSLVIEDSLFFNNQAASGGGAFILNSTVAVSGSRFISNQTDAYQPNGGGLYLYCSSGEIRNSSFRSNSAYNGGGLAVVTCSKDSLLFENVAVAANTSTSSAIWFYTSSPSGAAGEATLRSSILQDEDTNVGIHNQGLSVLSIENVAFINAGRAGLSTVAEGTSVSNSIFMDHESFGISSGTPISVTDTLFYGNVEDVNFGASPVGTNGNISADPVFVDYSADGDPTDDDLHLGAGSPAVDAGNSSPSYNDTDGSRNDIGAYGGPAGDWEPSW